jgi:hypothetical protein
MAGLDRPTQIALIVRRLRFLALPEVRSADLSELPARLDRRWQVGVPSLLDPVAWVGAEEVDRVCANAIDRLTSSKTTAAARRAIVDLLDCLDNDRKVALYFALPVEARRPLDRDPAFARVVEPLREEMGEALFDLDTLADLMGSELLRDAADEPDGFVLRMPERFRPILRRALIGAEQ